MLKIWPMALIYIIDFNRIILAKFLTLKVTLTTNWLLSRAVVNWRGGLPSASPVDRPVNNARGRDGN